MYLHVPLFLVLLVNVAPSDAALFSRGSDKLSSAATHVHRHVIKRSTGLLDDIRLAYAGIRQQKPQALLQQPKLHCVNNAGKGLAGIAPGGISTSNATGSDVPAGSSSSSAASSSIGSSRRPTSLTATPIAASPTSPVSSASAPSATGAAPSSPSSSASSSPWKVAQSYQGSSFFDGWDFQDSPDTTTHGVALYIDRDSAQAANLIEINDAGNAVMRVETTPTVSQYRKSIRITTQYSYTGGLIVLDAVHMPTGCGTWPAFWSNGPNWPAGGEIDMVEGVNDYTNNQVTLHTDPGCTMPSSDPSALDITGTLIATTDCSASETGNAGCGVRGSQTNSYGAAFNSIGGGVYATLWDDDGIKTWFFPRNSIPSDLANGAPQPDLWGNPMASFPASSCDPFKYFYQHTAIFDTTLCGDWAGGVWGAAGVPGQEQSCAARTNVQTCEDFVLNHGSSFTDAYWEVKSVKIYQKSS
ncbi:Glycoside Hydrolase Family 16 protein [Trametes cinnabarina]|uniref:Glycoside Hydrolase Family 16 protein n=1 Tax=Pycnoporus cinnabarinus TaxID=5643 RepID=A0A060S8U8_PYCCI|nr:Glycoside Hydrolase Family 16 protein [Trametes cinnabarina]